MLQKLLDRVDKLSDVSIKLEQQQQQQQQQQLQQQQQQQQQQIIFNNTENKYWII